MPLDPAILNEMTLAEKIGQLTMVTAGYATTGPIVAGDTTTALKAGRIGSLFNLWGRDAVCAAQRRAVEETRLGIPLFFGLDVIHGFRTIFPIPLAEAGAFDVELWERTAMEAAAEAAAEGIDLTFTPMLDIGRDPRWGRIAEGVGEDPLTGARFARAKVQGLQGRDFAGDGRLAACAKHFVAYGAVTAGRDYAPVDISRRTLEEVYLPPFHAAVEAGVATVMPAFTDLDGVPLSANGDMLHGVLRGRWRFEGIVISDYGAIGELIKHGVAGDLAEAAALALNAGIDIDMMAYAYERGLPDALDRGLVTAATLDAAVMRVLRFKERLGLFDNPYRRCGEGGDEDPGRRISRRLAAREAGRRSLVLLKNEVGLLPLDSGYRRIAVIGPLADAPAEMLGPWASAGKGADAVSVLAGLREALPGIEIVHAGGVPIAAEDRGGIAAAVEAARSADCVILCLGEAAGMSGEAASRARIDLPGCQDELFTAVAETARPLVVLLFSGRPLAAPDVFARADAVLACWFPGSEAGHAIADVVAGKASPVGRLPVTWPRHVGQVPIYFAERTGGRPENPADKYTSRYLDLPNTPEFPFGHGLGYGDVVFSDLAVDVGEGLAVSLTASNRGARDDETVVFLFIRDPVASVARPALELKDFARLRLAAGESVRMTFTITREQLSFLDRHLAPVFEGGDFEILAGPSADRGRLLSTTVTYR
jgi:beta-glucosidase